MPLEMSHELHREVCARLVGEFHFKHNAQSNRFEKGECPNCGKKELWTGAENPWMVRCNRRSKCGYDEHVKNLFPDIFDKWADRHPQTPADPNAAAKAYLRDARGFDIARLEGWYTQEYFHSPELGIGSATVRFPLPWGGFFERIIAEAWRFGSQKARIVGKYKGHLWTPPGLDLATVRELWITEGIFDAIALWLAGLPAASILSASHYPADALEALKGQAIDSGRPTLIWALDGDKAGQHYTREWVKRSRAEGWPAEAASIPAKEGKKLDWNEAHQRGLLTEEHLKDYRYQGALLTAASAQEKALLIHKEKGWHSFSLDFDNRLFWFEVDLDKLAKEAEKIQKEHEDWDREKCEAEALQRNSYARQIANCLPVPLYHQSNDLTDESWYYFRVSFPHEGPDVKMTFTPGQLASAPEFKKRLMSAPGAYWEGKPTHLDRLMAHWVYNIKTVKTIDFIGYAEDYKAYIFNDYAVKDGKIYTVNDQDFFDIGKKQSVKTLSQSVKLKLNADPKSYDTSWIAPLWGCFGEKAVIALAYWLGTAFSNQIVDRHESFPFLAITGVPGSGKSTVIQFLWKLFGRYGYEGFDPRKGSASFFRRNMAQTTFAVVLSESDREQVEGSKGRPEKVFQWDDLKDAYGHGKVYGRGVKSNDNNTLEPDFKGSIVISQNAEVMASPAIQERILDLRFTKDGQTEATNRLAEQIEHYEAADISYFLFDILIKEKVLMAEYEQKYKIHYGMLGKTIGERLAIKNFRTRRNHAQLKALIDCLALVVKLSNDQIRACQAYADDMAVKRERMLGKDHPLIEEFWQTVDYLEDGEAFAVNHSYDPRLIAINLNHYEQMASLARQRIPLISELKRVLRESKSHKFVDIRAVTSSINKAHNKRQELLPYDQQSLRAETVKCWVFEK